MVNTRKTTTPARKRAPAREKPAPPKPDPLAVIAAAKLPEKTVELCLRGDLVAQVEDLERQMQAVKPPTDRMVGNVEGRKLAAQIGQLQQQMRSSTIVFHLRALSHREYRDFIVAHPPRDDNQVDAMYGYNRETYFTDLTRLCLTAPELDDEQWEQLLNALTAKQWDELAGAADSLNSDSVSVPFSGAASLILGSGEK